jgi:hypothetical protein
MQGGFISSGRFWQSVTPSDAHLADNNGRKYELRVLPTQSNMPLKKRDQPTGMVRMNLSETRDRNREKHPSVEDLRHEHRYKCTVTTIAIHSNNVPEPFGALILDVSKSGLRLLAPRAISRGQQVTIVFANAKRKPVIHAEARYCRSDQVGTYEIGLEITDSIDDDQ